MTPAYNKIYLEKAQKTLGYMLDFAVNILNYSLTDFYDLFLKSKASVLFGNGNCKVIAGVSGIELAFIVLEENGLQIPSYQKDNLILQPSKEFWCGFALAYFQWNSGLSFLQIQNKVPIETVLLMYNPYHEMDLRHFVDKLSEKFY